MKTKLFSIFLLLSVAVELYAYKFKVGGLCYYCPTESSDAVAVVNSSSYQSLTSIIIPESVTYKGITYNVTSIGDVAFHNCPSLTSITIPNSVTSIGNGAFSYCFGLTSITISSSVTSIGENAFEECWVLTSVIINSDSIVSANRDYNTSLESIFGSQVTEYIIGDDVHSIGDGAFYGCTGLTSITIPNSVTDIGNDAFYGCTGLTSITIPNSVTDIGNDAFYGCTGLTSITIPNSVTDIGNDAFYGCTGLTSVTINSDSIVSANRDYNTSLESIFGSQVTEYIIGDDVHSIGDLAFYSYTGTGLTTSITIGNSVTDIGDWAFSGCTGLTSITIGNSVTDIGDHAFSGCTGLTSITIPNSVTSIGHGAFSNTGLYSIFIPKSVIHIGVDEWNWLNNNVYSIFSKCGSLTSIEVEESNPVYDSRDFSNSIIEKATNTLIAGCNNTRIPETIDSIGVAALAYCSDLTFIKIPGNVKTIGAGAFHNCDNLKGVVLENGVDRIGSYAFAECHNLKSVSIPNTVTIMDHEVFINCKSLQFVSIPHSVTKIGEATFSFCQSLDSIRIPGSITEWGYYSFRDCSNLKSVSIENGVPYIPDLTFNGCTNLQSIKIPNSVWEIGIRAFEECKNLTSITIPVGISRIGVGAFAGTELTSVICYAIKPPSIFNTGYYGEGEYTDPFEGLPTMPLYVPAESVEKYKSADCWMYFNVLPLSAQPTESDDKPILTPGDTDVDIIWPSEQGAAIYTIDISKNGDLVCTLTFDANGILQSIRFLAHTRGIEQHTTQTTQTSNSGFNFVVEGLDSGTTYTYVIAAKNTAGNIIQSYSGSFTTTGEQTDIKSISVEAEDLHKFIRNGQVLIHRNGKLYTTTGIEVQ